MYLIAEAEGCPFGRFRFARPRRCVVDAYHMNRAYAELCGAPILFQSIAPRPLSPSPAPSISACLLTSTLVHARSVTKAIHIH